MGFVNYDTERWCTRCGRKQSIMFTFCPDCGCRLRYKRRMKVTAARVRRLARHRLPSMAEIDKL